MSKEDFLKDRKTQQAVIYNIFIIGEAATQIINGFSDFAEAHPNIPWREMRGIRNRMAHGYHELNLDIIWETVTGHLHELGRQVSQIEV